jgi:glutaredoxin
MAEITVYSNTWCCDCRRAKSFLKDRGISFREINIDHNPEAEATVLRVNNGKRKVPTIEIEGRYFPMSPFDPCRFAEELKIPLNK